MTVQIGTVVHKIAFYVFNLAYAEQKFGFGKQTLAYINVLIGGCAV